jgi:hypothetical protein
MFTSPVPWCLMGAWLGRPGRPSSAPLLHGDCTAVRTTRDPVRDAGRRGSSDLCFGLVLGLRAGLGLIL